MGGAYNLRHLGMIATSPSWRRWWLEWRWKRYPMSAKWRYDSDIF